LYKIKRIGCFFKIVVKNAKADFNMEIVIKQSIRKEPKDRKNRLNGNIKPITLGGATAAPTAATA
jgi:hypothetical protein